MRVLSVHASLVSMLKVPGGERKYLKYCSVRLDPFTSRGSERRMSRSGLDIMKMYTVCKVSNKGAMNCEAVESLMRRISETFNCDDCTEYLGTVMQVPRRPLRNFSPLVAIHYRYTYSSNIRDTVETTPHFGTHDTGVI